ncbi:MAG: ABC transporter permease subunit [Pseudomonadota bacterium]
MSDMTITAASDIKVDRVALDASITEFAERNGDYYATQFHRIHESTGLIPVSFNLAAALLGPVWAAMRGIWGFFWGFLLLEMIAWVQIGRGAWGDLGGDLAERAAQQLERAQGFLERAAEATQAGEDPSRFETMAANLTRAAERSQAGADAAAAEATSILLFGLVLLIVFKLVQGIWANIVYERQYSRWRVEPDLVESGVIPRNLAFGIALVVLIAPLTIYKFTVTSPLEALNAFPADTEHYSAAATWLEARIDAAAIAGAGGFDSIVIGVRSVLDALTIALIGTPWPVVMLVICVIAWRAAGPRVAIFTAACLAYIAFLGYWEIAMETVALVGAAVIICVVIGIPLGIWFGKSQRAYRVAEPILDLMQTLPAFVYLIPIIAFFGTGNPPGILATIIFGMPGGLPVPKNAMMGMR